MGTKCRLEGMSAQLLPPIAHHSFRESWRLLELSQMSALYDILRSLIAAIYEEESAGPTICFS